MATAAGPRVGDAAPDFARPSAAGELIRLSDFRDRRHVVLYFYPRDNTAICTAQACEFRDRYADFSAADAVVIGISGNSLQSHRHFAETHALPFYLLSDADGSLRAIVWSRESAVADSPASDLCDRQARNRSDGFCLSMARTGPCPAGSRRASATQGRRIIAAPAARSHLPARRERRIGQACSGPGRIITLTGPVGRSDHPAARRKEAAKQPTAKKRTRVV